MGCAAHQKPQSTKTKKSISEEIREAYQPGVYLTQDITIIYTQPDESSKRIRVLRALEEVELKEVVDDEWGLLAAEGEEYVQLSFLKKKEEEKSETKTTEKQIVADILADTKTGKTAKQIITVIGPYKKSEGKQLYYVTLYNKDGNSWRQVLQTDEGLCGKNGLSDHRTRGDKTTPIGSFKLMYAFGQVKDPGSLMSYKQITKYSYWASSTNSWQESKKTISGEHLIEYKKAYKYAMALRFNMDPYVESSGNAIFLHCHSGRDYTAGCIAVPEYIMLRFIREVNSPAYIMIVRDQKDLSQY